MFIYDQQEEIPLGRQEGKKEEKRAIARKSLDRLDDETIAAITGLILEDIRELREKNEP